MAVARVAFCDGDAVLAISCIIGYMACHLDFNATPDVGPFERWSSAASTGRLHSADGTTGISSSDRYFVSTDLPDPKTLASHFVVFSLWQYLWLQYSLFFFPPSLILYLLYTRGAVLMPVTGMGLDNINRRVIWI